MLTMQCNRVMILCNAEKQSFLHQKGKLTLENKKEEIEKKNAYVVTTYDAKKCCVMQNDSKFSRKRNKAEVRKSKVKHTDR